MTVPEYKYDIALSFLAADQVLAGELADRLTPGLRVFYFPRVQEEIAGTDGQETFRLAFRAESRVAVVLYRDGWGSTAWTRVEQQAIQERCLADGWDCVFLVKLSPESTLPKWFPQTQLWLDFDVYGLEQIVGAIKARLQERGATVRIETAIERLKRGEQRAQRTRELRDRLQSHEGIGAARRELLAIQEELASLAAATVAAAAIPLREGHDLNRSVLTDGTASVGLYWQQEASNTLEGALLTVGVVTGRLLVPGERDLVRRQHEVDRISFQFDLTAEHGWCWKSERTGERLNSAQLAEWVLARYAETRERLRSGELQSPSRAGSRGVHGFDDSDETF